MAVRTWEAFFELLQKSGMLQGDRFEQAVTLTRELTEPTTIARRLVNEGLLSRWQAAQLLAGQDVQFLGKYKLLDELESTATSRVYLAEHGDMNRRVALKTLARRHNSDAAEAQQFQTDVAAVASLNHPAINHIYDVDCEGGNYYLIMEHSDGRTLDEVVRSEGPLEDITAARYLWQVAQGLAHAHQHGIVHQEIRPSKLVVTPRGTIKILEMGLRKLADDQLDSFGDPSQTRAEQVDYLAPELATGNASEDPRTDLYGLGCTLYFALTGAPPFAEGSTGRRLQQHASAPPPSILTSRPGAAPALAALAQQMMAKRPADRPQSAQAVVDACHAFISEYESKVAAPQPSARSEAGSASSKVGESASRVLPLDITSEETTPQQVAVETTHVPVGTTSDDAADEESSNRLPWILGGGAGGLLLLTVLVVAIMSSTTSPEIASTVTDGDSSETAVNDAASGQPPATDKALSPPATSTAKTSQVKLQKPQGKLIAQWDFQDDLNDGVGDFHGLAGPGAQLVSDPAHTTRGKVLSLDGSATAVVSVGPITELDGALTVAAWIKVSPQHPTDDVSLIVSDWDERPGAGRRPFLRLGLDAQQNPFVRLASPTGGVQAGTLVTARKVVKPDDGWVHIAFAAEVGKEIKLYRDGIMAGRGAYQHDRFPETRRSFVMGNDKMGRTQTAFRGWLDDVRIYNRALSAVEIKQLFDETHGAPTASLPPSPAEPVGRWTMKKMPHTRVMGGKGKPPGKFMGTKLPQTEGAIRFDGKENYVQIKGLKIPKTNYISFTAWIRGSPTGDRSGIVVSRGTHQHENACSLMLTADRKLGYIWEKDKQTCDIASDLLVPKDQWAFVAGTIEPKRARLFLWTEADKLKHWEHEAAHEPLEIDDLEIGRDMIAKDRYFQGYIADVRVYKGVVSDKTLKNMAKFTKRNLPELSQLVATAASTTESSPQTPPKKEKPARSREPLEHETGFAVLKPRGMQAKGDTRFEVRQDNSIFARLVGKPASESYSLTFDTADVAPEMNCITALRFEALPDDALPAGGPGYGSAGDFSIAELRVAVAPRDAPDQRKVLRLVDPISSDPSAGSLKFAVDGDVKRRWVAKAPRGRPISATFRIADPLDCASGSLLFVLVQTGDPQRRLLGHFRVAASTASPEKLGISSATPKPSAKRRRRNASPR